MATIPTYEVLRAMPDEKLIQAFNAHEGNRVGADFIRHEIALREQERQTAAMLAHTLTMKRLTWVITALTLVVTVATLANLFGP